MQNENDKLNNKQKQLSNKRIQNANPKEQKKIPTEKNEFEQISDLSNYNVKEIPKRGEEIRNHEKNYNICKSIMIFLTVIILIVFVLLINTKIDIIEPIFTTLVITFFVLMVFLNPKMEAYEKEYLNLTKEERQELEQKELKAQYEKNNYLKSTNQHNEIYQISYDESSNEYQLDLNLDKTNQSGDFVDKILDFLENYSLVVLVCALPILIISGVLNRIFYINGILDVSDIMGNIFNITFALVIFSAAESIFITHENLVAIKRLRMSPLLYLFSGALILTVFDAMYLYIVNLKFFEIKRHYAPLIKDYSYIYILVLGILISLVIAKYKDKKNSLFKFILHLAIILMTIICLELCIFTDINILDCIFGLLFY